MGPKIEGWRIEVIATDLSNDVLEKARQGIYSQFEVQRGLPIQLLIKYFSQVGDVWQIAPEIRAMVKYRQFNLLSDFYHLGAFDLIFCRNVLIYFDQETKIGVLNRLREVIAGDGYLVLGAAETVVGLTDKFRTVADLRGLYVPNPPSARMSAQAAAGAARAAPGGSERRPIRPADCRAANKKTPANAGVLLILEALAAQAEIFASSSIGSRST